MPKIPSLISITAKRIHEGLYLQYEGKMYRVIGTNGLQIRLASEDFSKIKYLDILNILQSDSVFVLEGSLAEENIKLGSTKDESSFLAQEDIPMTFRDHAHRIVALVEGFVPFLQSAQQHSGGNRSKHEILVEYLAQTTISQSTYYKYKKLYDAADGNLLRIASSLRRKPRRPLSDS